MWRRRPAVQVLLYGLFGIVACQDPNSCEERWESVDLLVANAVKSQAVDRIDLAEVIRFPWDRMYVFPAYTSAKDVAAATGLVYSLGWLDELLVGPAIFVSESHDLIVFVANDGVVCFEEVRDDTVSSVRWAFSSETVGSKSLYNPTGISRANAFFRILRASGQPRLILDGPPTIFSGGEVVR